MCPDVMVAQIDPKKLKKNQTVNISVSMDRGSFVQDHTGSHLVLFCLTGENYTV